MSVYYNSGPTKRLKHQLIDWWELGDLTGKHNGETLTGSIGASLIDDPFGGQNAWYANSSQSFRPIPPTSIDMSQPHTLAGVFYRGNDSVGLYFARTDNGDVTILYNYNEQIGITSYAGGTTNTSSRLSFSTGWFSFVATYDGANLKTYLNNQLIQDFASSPSGEKNVGLCYFFRLGPDARMALSCQSTRHWQERDVELFHNNGNFLKYENLK